MPIFSSLAGFFRRNKRKIIITTTVAASVYVLINEFVIKKFRNYQNSLRQELLFKRQIKQRFLQTQQDCYYTILALLPVLTGPIVEYLPVELITQALRLKKTEKAKVHTELTSENLNLLENNHDPESSLSHYMNMSKIELWNLLKIKTITRTLTLMYSISGLLLISKLQLNILARRSYLESAILMAGVKSVNNDVDPHENYITEQSYLSLSWWLLNKGWINLNSIIEALATKRFDKITPKQELTMGEFDSLLQDIITEINTNNREFILANLFPINYSDLLETMMNTNPDLIHQLEIPESNLLKLINETNSIMLDSNVYFFDLLNTLILTNLNILSSNLSMGLGNNNMGSSLLLSTGNLQQDEENKIVEIPNKSYKLANFLAQLSIQNGIMMDNDNLKGELPTKSQEQLDEDDIQGFINNLTTLTGDQEHGEEELSGNVYINNLNQLDELDDFSAGIYSNFE